MKAKEIANKIGISISIFWLYIRKGIFTPPQKIKWGDYFCDEKYIQKVKAEWAAYLRGTEKRRREGRKNIGFNDEAAKKYFEEIDIKINEARREGYYG
jgi:predicted site-specific integrase-resolvase